MDATRRVAARLRSVLAALLLAAALTASPVVQPPNDPAFGHCLDPRDGIRLYWQRPQNGALTYLLVKREESAGDWRPWLKTRRADPPFLLRLHSPLARRAHFAWMLFEVEHRQVRKTPWRYFCTDARNGGKPPREARLSR